MLLYRIKGKYRPMFLVWGEVLECKHQNHIYASRSSFCSPISPWRHKRHLFVSSVVIDPASFFCVSHQETFLIFLSLSPSYVGSYSFRFTLPHIFSSWLLFQTVSSILLSMCMLMYSSSVWHYYYCNQVKLYSSHKSILPSLYRDGTKRPSEHQETVYSIQLLYCPIEG